MNLVDPKKYKDLNIGLSKKLGKTEDEIRKSILDKAQSVIASGRKPYKIPDSVLKGNPDANGKYVCIQGVCGILTDAGIIPHDYYTNTKFAEKAESMGFSRPLTDVSKLKPGDVFQHLAEKN